MTMDMFVGEDGVRYEYGMDDLASYDGKELDLYGVDPLDKRFQLGNAVFALIEDNTGCDDYHGPTIGAVVIEPNHSAKIGRHKIARVRVEYENGGVFDDGWVSLTDVEDGHVWLEFCMHGEYYPVIVFNYSPKVGRG